MILVSFIVFTKTKKLKAFGDCKPQLRQAFSIHLSSIAYNSAGYTVS